MMQKVKRLSELKEICQKLRDGGKTIGLITGCFDILHIEHIELFRFAKRQVDFLVVGLENDKTIKISKGKNRPVFSQTIRSRVLSELESVDYIFLISNVVDFDVKDANKVYENITKVLKPTVLVTAPSADKYWEEKEGRSNRLGIKFIPFSKDRKTSSSKIIKALEEEL